jgi:hypothetical protein
VSGAIWLPSTPYRDNQVEEGDMITLRTIVLASLGLVVGLLIGAWWTVERVEAQPSRFQTERHGELLFIRYFNSVTGVDCYVGMNSTGIIPVPCDRRDQEAVRR